MTAAQPRAWLVSAGWGLAILTLINLFNYLDRFIVASLFESLKHSELAPSDRQLGFLMSAFLIVYMLAAPVFGALGDRRSRSRPRLIAFGVACWSLATALSGLAGSYLALIIARASVGIGEAAYGTIAPSLLADYFPASRRGRVMAIFFCAIPIGSALGYVIGGLIDERFGWRMAFFVAGTPGLMLAALCLLLPDSPRGQQDGPAPVGAGVKHTGVAATPRVTYWRLIRDRPYLLTVLGYAAYTFAVGGLGAWMPAFLERVRGLSEKEATQGFGAIVVVTGFVGTFAGGWLGDYCLRYTRRAYMWLCGISMLLATPFVWAALTTSAPIALALYMVIAQFLIFLSTGPINAAIVNMVSPLERASAIALSVFAIHLLGDVISPPIIGAISDVASLGQAVKIVPVAVLVSGLVWCLAARAQRVPDQ
jgi:MFS transporter, Spinster family, sphingosine-1-phosphate transporter